MRDEPLAAAADNAEFFQKKQMRLEQSLNPFEKKVLPMCPVYKPLKRGLSKWFSSQTG
jgi:hypothetical protein